MNQRKVRELEVVGNLDRGKHRTSDVQLSGFENDGWAKETGAAASTASFDSAVYASGTQSLKLHTENWLVASKTVSWNMTGKGVSFALVLSAYDITTSLSLRFYDAAGNYLLAGSVAVPNEWFGNLVTSWQYIVVHPADMSQVGAVDLTAIVKCALHLDIAAGSVDAWIDDLCLVEPIKPGKVIFSYDDELATISTQAAPVLKQYGIRACLNVRTANIDAATYMTTAQIRQLHNDGWDITSHGYNHASLTSSDGMVRRTELAGSRDALRDLGLCRGLEFYTLPNGDFTQSYLPEVQEHYKKALTVQTKYNLPSPKQPVLYRHLADALSEAQVKVLIDNIKTNGGILILCLHGYTTWLSAVCAYLAAQQVEAITLTDLYGVAGARL